MPTENSLAQAGWLSENIGGLDLTNEIGSSVANTHAERPYEAKAFQFYASGNWDEAIKNAECWLADQPFSSRPVALAAHIKGAIQQDYRGAMDLIEFGQWANPDEPYFLNLSAFCLGSMGDLDGAWKALKKIKTEAINVRDSVTRAANLGLIQFRLGDTEAGETFYRDAEERAARAKLPILQALALIYWARETTKAGLSNGPELLEKAQKAMEPVQVSPELNNFKAQFENILGAVKKSLSTT